MEIGRYRRSDGAERIEFIDVADPDVDPGPDLPREDAMGRFHVRLPSGELKAGAAAFVEIWRVLTIWRTAAMVASLRGATPALELGYRLVSTQADRRAAASARLRAAGVPRTLRRQRLGL